jgi:antitoxin (DNA-binding transcriptional repressor) of toxin-antitoxin stability system
MTHMERVGIREMRQNLSRYAQRAKQGESFVLTDRGEEIAQLVPGPGRMTEIDRLVIERGARRGIGSILDIPPVDVPGPPSEEILEEQRAERLE